MEQEECYNGTTSNYNQSLCDPDYGLYFFGHDRFLVRDCRDYLFKKEVEEMIIARRIYPKKPSDWEREQSEKEKKEDSEDHPENL